MDVCGASAAWERCVSDEPVGLDHSDAKICRLAAASGPVHVVPVRTIEPFSHIVAGLGRFYRWTAYEHLVFPRSPVNIIVRDSPSLQRACKFPRNNANFLNSRPLIRPHKTVKPAAVSFHRCSECRKEKGKEIRPNENKNKPHRHHDCARKLHAPSRLKMMSKQKNNIYILNRAIMGTYAGRRHIGIM